MNIAKNEAVEEPSLPAEEVSHARAGLKKLKLINADPITVDPYGVVAIVGPNNSGKSTLLKQIVTAINYGHTTYENLSVRLIDSHELFTIGGPGELLGWLKRNAHYVPMGDSDGAYSLHGSQWALGDIQRLWGSIPTGHALADLSGFFSYSANGNNRFALSEETQARANGFEPPQMPLHSFQDDRTLFDGLRQLSKQVFGEDLTLDDTGTSISIRLGRTDVLVPRLDESRSAYATALSKLPTIGAQGDGMRAFFSLFIPLLSGFYSVVAVDEPEAFLHPPQAYAAGKALGEIANGSRTQVILATHDRDFLAGVLAAKAPLTIIRLQREKEVTRPHNIASGNLRELWDDRLLRYSNVLSSLFHKLVVLCEAEQDCKFYQAALEDYLPTVAPEQFSVPITASDVLFVPTNGKSGLARIAKITQSAGVPTVIIADIDALDSETVMKQMVAALEGEWGPLVADYRKFTEPLAQGKGSPSIAGVGADLARYFGEKALRGNEVFTPDMQEDVKRILRITESKWTEIRNYGLSATKGEQYQSGERLLRGLDKIGVVVVEVGSLEGFARHFNKNRSWLKSALDAEAQKSEPARRLIESLLKHRFLV